MTTHGNRKPPPSRKGSKVGFKTGRQGAPYTDIHEWVMFSSASAEAKALYVIMRAHVNRERGDNIVWMSGNTLAILLGYSRGDKIKKFLDELVKLGALSEPDRAGVHGVNVYEVHREPPKGYTGPLSVDEWYAANGPELDNRREIDKAGRDARRARQRAAMTGDEQQNTRSTPVTPGRGEQASEDAVAPGRGEHVAPKRGEELAPVSGREPTLGVEVLSKGTVRTSSPPTPSAADVETSPPVGGEDPEQNTAISSKIENQETQADIEAKDFFPTLTDWEAQLLAECRDLAPMWSSSKLTKVIGSRTVREVTARNPELVRRAFLIGARDPKTVPMRMWWVEKCPHWQTALAQITAEAAAAAGPNDETSPGGAPSGAADRAEPGPAPARRTVPEQRAADRVAPVSPGAPNAAYLAQKAAAAERIAARRQAEELEQRERAARLAEVLGEAGVGGSVRVESTLGDPVLRDLPVAPALEPVGGNVATVR